MTEIDNVRRLLLISNSTAYGSGYLDHAEAVKDLLRDASRVVFVPFALPDRDLLPREVEVLDAQAQTLQQPQSAAVQQLADEAVGAFEFCQHELNFRPC